jgi:gamma-glutamylcyclotransferase (GGCT)/AIG2-like uncharacterized protein YtfP
MIKFYAAYGSNLNVRQMRQRCPLAKSISMGNLFGWRLCFKGVADIVPSKNSSVPVGIYKTTPACEDSLDIYEDYPTLYRKQNIKVHTAHKSVDCFVYVMNPGFGLEPPSGYYFDTIREGYDNWNMMYAPLIEGLRNAFEKTEKNFKTSTNLNQYKKLSRREANERLRQLNKAQRY